MLPDSILPTPEDDIARILANFEKRISHLERLEQGGLGLGARVRNSLAITIPNNIVTFLTFDNERFDTDNIHSTVLNTGRLTARTPGIYVISGNVRWTANATGYRLTRITLNGTTIICQDRRDIDSSILHQISITTIYELSINDFVELGVLQTSGGNLDVIVNNNDSPEFMMVKIG